MFTENLLFYPAVLFLIEPIKFIKNYVTSLAQSLNDQGYEVTKIQQFKLATILSVILLCNRVCWSDVELVTLGKHTSKTTWWFANKSTMPWSRLFLASTQMMLHTYGITEGVIAIDETDNPRSKKTPFIGFAHKYFEKKSGGYKNGQEIVFLVLITSTVTIPVGFEFYEPDEGISQWKKSDKKLKKEGVAKKDRPKCPPADTSYRSKTQIAASLVKDFKKFNPGIKIKAVVADALYGSKSFYDSMAEVETQLISQLKSDQKVTYRGEKYMVKDFFNKVFKPFPSTITVRGDAEQKVMFRAIRVYVNAHECKRFVIALKYEGQSEYRYFVASNLSWRGQDIANAYTLRWLVEVFFEDTKVNGGWFKMAKQQGEDGSEKSLTLSLLLDHAFLSHPEQKARIKSKLPAYTVGSLRALEAMKVTIDFTRHIISYDDPEAMLAKALERLQNIITLRESKKHMSKNGLGYLDETASLKHKKVA